MITWRRMAGLAGLLALLANPASAAERSFRVYPLGVQDGPTVQAAAEMVLAPPSRVLLDRTRNRLLANATADEHRALAHLVREVAAPAANVRIEVRSRDAGTSEDVRAGLERPEIRIRHRDGRTTGTAAADVAIEARRTRTLAQTTQEILVSSGREGVIEVGQEVPYTEWLFDYAIRHGLVRTPDIRWRLIGARMVVLPTIVGDGPLIHVRLIPEVTAEVQGHPERVRFERVATEVTVRDGEPLRIGGFAENRDFYDRFLVGVGRGGQTRALDISLIPRIERPGVPPTEPIPGRSGPPRGPPFP